MLDFDDLDEVAAERVAAGEELDEAAKASLSHTEDEGNEAPGCSWLRERKDGKKEASQFVEDLTRQSTTYTSSPRPSHDRPYHEAARMNAAKASTACVSEAVDQIVDTDVTLPLPEKGLHHNILQRVGVAASLHCDLVPSTAEVAAHSNDSDMEDQGGENQERLDENWEEDAKPGSTFSAGRLDTKPETEKSSASSSSRAVPQGSPASIQWEARLNEVHFRIFDEVLPMQVEREGMLPHEFIDLWEREWGIIHARSLRFSAPPDMERKWLRPREDPVPVSPAVIALEGKGSILYALRLALSRHDPRLKARMADAAKQRCEADRKNPLLRGQAGARGGAEMEPVADVTTVAPRKLYVIK